MDNINLELAQMILAHATGKTSKKYQQPICISVCDKCGFLVAFARMNGAPLRSIEISRRKAFTAIWMGVPTNEFASRLRKDQIQAGDFGDKTLCGLPGGNLIKDSSGCTLGGIGVSGLSADEDQSIANTMADLVKSIEI